MVPWSHQEGRSQRHLRRALRQRRPRGDHPTGEDQVSRDLQDKQACEVHPVRDVTHLPLLPLDDREPLHAARDHAAKSHPRLLLRSRDGSLRGLHRDDDYSDSFQLLGVLLQDSAGWHRYPLQDLLLPHAAPFLCHRFRLRCEREDADGGRSKRYVVPCMYMPVLLVLGMLHAHASDKLLHGYVLRRPQRAVDDLLRHDGYQS
mmetsp:Transcript_13199/g.26221  ORF Transcript_13199/g.26221 Transcript_13199/m.26221 type:complete len:203 (+) Transcript_13199:859-1467(+)